MIPSGTGSNEAAFIFMSLAPNWISTSRKIRSYGLLVSKGFDFKIAAKPKLIYD